MTRIALVVSDVDGTLLTKDKILTEKTARAVRQLEDSGEPTKKQASGKSIRQERP